jgi:phosphoribosyl 1,2-cyclic phosphate phosphodiesterase
MTIDALMREFAYAFAEKRYPGVPNLEMNEIDLSPFMIGDIPVIPIMVWHLKMPVFGYRFGSFTYITDANRIDEGEKEKIKGTSVIVLNTLRKETHISHFTLSEAVDLTKALSIPQGFGTHISHQLGKHADIERELPDHFKLSYDGLSIEI